MNRLTRYALATLIALPFCVACRAPKSAGDSGEQEGACGVLAVWILPEGVRVSSTDLDSAWVAQQADITRARLNLVAQASEAYCRVHERYPTSLHELSTAASEGTLPPGCAGVGEFSEDAWGDQLAYSLRDSGPLVVSSGPDRRPGTEDDLRVARPGDEGARELSGEITCRD